VIAAQQAPDHATIARFRVRHEAALAGLAMCRESGLVKVGLIAIDGTKVHANASHHSNLDYEQLVREILKEAAAVDAAEDELYGEKRGDELPEHLQTSEGRRKALREAKRKLESGRASKHDTTAQTGPQAVKIAFDPEVIVARVQGRDGWLREARHQLEEHRRIEAEPIGRSRPERLLEAERRLQENLLVEREANEAYETHRANARTTDGRRFGARPNVYVAPGEHQPIGSVRQSRHSRRKLSRPGWRGREGGPRPRHCLLHRHTGWRKQRALKRVGLLVSQRWRSSRELGRGYRLRCRSGWQRRQFGHVVHRRSGRGRPRLHRSSGRGRRSAGPGRGAIRRNDSRTSPALRRPAHGPVSGGPVGARQRAIPLTDCPARPPRPSGLAPAPGWGPRAPLIGREKAPGSRRPNGGCFLPCRCGRPAREGSHQVPAAYLEQLDLLPKPLQATPTGGPD